MRRVCPGAAHALQVQPLRVAASPWLQYETEFDFGGTKVFVSTCVVEG